MGTLKVTNIQDTSGNNSSTSEQIYQGRARIWWYYDQRGTPSIENSYRVSSVTDNATGQYTVNYTDTLSSPCGVSGASYNDNAFDGQYSDVANIYAANTYAEVQTPNMGSAAPGSSQLHDCDYNYGVIYCDV
jgi:hypothetical protein